MAALGRGLDARSTDIASGLGPPAWIASAHAYCSRCGEELVFGPLAGENRDRLACAACGFVAYINPRLVVTTLPVSDSGELTLLRRGIEPGYGSWAQPGGFLEVDETVAEAAIRETLEETGLVVEPGPIVGLYSRLEAAVVVLAFPDRGRDGPDHPGGARGPRVRGGLDPLGGHRLQDHVLGAPRLGRAPPPRSGAAGGLPGPRRVLVAPRSTPAPRRRTRSNRRSTRC
jgi:ribosomal protein S27AE